MIVYSIRSQEQNKNILLFSHVYKIIAFADACAKTENIIINKANNQEIISHFLLCLMECFTRLFVSICYVKDNRLIKWFTGVELWIGIDNRLIKWFTGVELWIGIDNRLIKWFTGVELWIGIDNS